MISGSLSLRFEYVSIFSKFGNSWLELGAEGSC